MSAKIRKDPERSAKIRKGPQMSADVRNTARHEAIKRAAPGESVVEHKGVCDKVGLQMPLDPAG